MFHVIAHGHPMLEFETLHELFVKFMGPIQLDTSMILLVKSLLNSCTSYSKKLVSRSYNLFNS